MENYNGLPGKAEDPRHKKYSESLKDTALKYKSFQQWIKGKAR